MQLEQLLSQVDERAPGGDPLARVAAARDLCFELTTLGDQVVDHVVGQARDQGCSWAQIGSVLGVSRQGAQQRHGGVLRRPWLHAPRRGPSGVARFGPDARRAVVEAQTAARSMGHGHVDTEHLLLGILASGSDALGAAVLARRGLDRRAVESEVVAIVGRGTDAATGRVPFAPRAKKALELSLREALALGDSRIGTEHVLLALLRERNGVAARVLTGHGVDRGYLLTVLRSPPGEESQP